MRSEMRILLINYRKCQTPRRQGRGGASTTAASAGQRGRLMIAACLLGFVTGQQGSVEVFSEHALVIFSPIRQHSVFPAFAFLFTVITRRFAPA